jgi:hypothetical protein
MPISGCPLLLGLESVSIACGSMTRRSKNWSQPQKPQPKFIEIFWKP